VASFVSGGEVRSGRIESPVEIQAVYERLRASVCGVIVGKDRIVDLCLIALLAGGHVLLTDVPGVGKTTLARVISASIAGGFSRIQFTPDLLPSDITGTSVYDPREARFEWLPGPVFAPVLLADEINRATPRTQSALLEAMAEGPRYREITAALEQAGMARHPQETPEEHARRAARQLEEPGMARLGEIYLYARFRDAVPAALVEEFDRLEPQVLAATERLKDVQVAGR
jgi:hypothetical protein